MSILKEYIFFCYFETDLHKPGNERVDVSVSAQILGVEGQAVVDHGHHQPRVEDVQGPFSHFGGLHQDDELLEGLVDLVLVALFYDFGLFFFLVFFIDVGQHFP